MSNDDRAIENFRNYLRIPSVQPDVDYTACIDFLLTMAKDVDLTTQIFELVPKKPILIMTWTGTVPALPSILLNSHMDVVPVYPDLWTHDPFGADIDSNGNIYARGSQDAKCIGIQYIEAIRRLKAEGKTLRRTVHISFVPDEEAGSGGMVIFATSPEFKSLNVGFTLDEGAANPGPEFLIYNGEKSAWQIRFEVSGKEGHGSLALVDTAGEKLRSLIDFIMDYRKMQMQQLNNNPSLTVGNLTFVNMTMTQGGVASNVVPPVISATFDFRLAVDENHSSFQKLVEAWASLSGDNIKLVYERQEPPTPITPIDGSNVFWAAMKQSFDSMNQNIITGIFSGATDSRFLRRQGLSCISFSPMNFSTYLAHANDEFLNKDVFLRGIDVYYNLIPSIANVQ